MELGTCALIRLPSINKLHYYYYYYNYYYYYYYYFLLCYISDYSVISRLHKRQIEQNRAVIIENLNLDDVYLISDLQSQDVISSNMARIIQRTTDHAEKNTILLNYILKQSKACLERFQDVLRKHRQGHVAQLFDEPGKTSIIANIEHRCLNRCR